MRPECPTEWPAGDDEQTYKQKAREDNPRGAGMAHGERSESLEIGHGAQE